jgi:crotonobetainyl-CoA:carnitine CoA-transferase CaiB-like acyl-CoA transferase
VLFRDPVRRAEHEARLREAYRRSSRAELVEAFHRAGLGAEAVVPMSEVFSHPQFVANGMAAVVTDAEFGETTQIGVPAVLDRTPGAIQSGQPRVGEHSREVLAAVGYSAAEVDGLVRRGVVEEGDSWDH